MVICVSAILTLGCSQSGPQLDDAGNYFVEAQQALADGDTEKAMELLTASIDARPDAWAYFQRAKLCAEAGDDAQANQDCAAGLELHPENQDLLWLQKELNKTVTGRFKGRNAQPPRAAK